MGVVGRQQIREPNVMNSYAMARCIELWPPDRLLPYDRNPRTHSDRQVTQIAASIAEFGFCNPVLVDTASGIIAGHGRLMAARKLNLEQVPVIVLDHLSPLQRRAYLIADNKLAEEAGWNEELLAAELTELDNDGFDLPVIGFSDAELSELLQDPDEITSGNTDEDAVPEVKERVVSQVGDLWSLGQHRLLVGDTTLRHDVEHLMAGEAADFVFTDPPYNCDYQGYTEAKLKITNDRMSDADFKAFMEASFHSLRSVVKPGASLYVCHASSVQREFQNALESAGFTVRCQIIWGKNTFAWGFGRYKFQHEPIFYCHVAGEKDPWYGDKSQSTLWQEKKPSANRLHPTMKPVELIERALMNSSKAGDLVVDLFGGSGSTLIGCERRGRKARLMEIDPKYADVIVARYQDYSGQAAVLEGDGRTFEEVARVRLEEAA